MWLTYLLNKKHKNISEYNEYLTLKCLNSFIYYNSPIQYRAIENKLLAIFNINITKSPIFIKIIMFPAHKDHNMTNL